MSAVKCDVRHVAITTCALTLAAQPSVALADFLGIGKFVESTGTGLGHIAHGIGSALEGLGKTVTGNPEGPLILDRGRKEIGEGIVDAAPAIVTVVAPPLGGAMIAAPDVTKFLYETTQKWKGTPACNPDAQIARLMVKPKRTLGDVDRLVGENFPKVFDGLGSGSRGCRLLQVGLIDVTDGADDQIFLLLGIRDVGKPHPAGSDERGRNPIVRAAQVAGEQIGSERSSSRSQKIATWRGIRHGQSDFIREILFPRQPKWNRKRAKRVERAW